MTYIYNLQIIPGTKDFVEQELREKYPEVEIINANKSNIGFSSDSDDIDHFNGLFSPLRIVKYNGLTRNLFRREWRKEYVPAGINPALAYVMCMIAEVNEQDTVLDPFCGGGTIAVTAALYFDPTKVLASDLSGTAIDKTLINFRAAAIKKNKFAVFRSNVSQLKLQPNTVSKLITNLPFGVRTGDHGANQKAYAALSEKMKTMMKPGGKLVILTQEKQLLLNCFAKPQYKLLDQIDIEQGGLIPRIFVYQKVA